MTDGIDARGSYVPGSDGFVAAFRAAAAADPDRAAVVTTEARLTYAELDRWSDAIATDVTAGIGPGPDPVMILTGGDEWTVAALVAAAKAGRPSALLDSTVPVSRMQSICDVAMPAATLFAPALAAPAEALGPAGGHLLALPGPSDAPVDPGGGGVEAPDALLTVMFTSGSTGRPKGVMVGSVPMARALFEWDAVGGAGERIGCPIPLSFAFGQITMLRALVTGSEFHVYDPRRDGIDGMAEWLDRNRVAVVCMTPHMARALTETLRASGTVLPSLRHVVVGGEAVLASDVAGLRPVIADDAVVYCQFGSSEGWFMARLPMDRDYPLPEHGAVAAGHAPPGREILLVDESGAPVTGPGRAGRIKSVAQDMAAGYWRDPELTAARFARLDDGRRVYDTGDLGRWNERGELEYIGRSDNMLKIRGYLVEPAEVETHLRARGEVRDCVVVGREADGETGGVILVAYVVPDPDVWVSGAAVRRRLIEELPSYMVPTQFVELTALPRNQNGKVDRLHLPAPAALQRGQEDTAWGYRGVAAAICASALGLERLGPDEDIFALGADSLAVEAIAAALEEVLGIPVSSASILENPTPAQLSRLDRDGARQLVDGVLVTLSAQGEGVPLFAIAGAGGLALQFRDLAHQLGGDRPVYGLQGFGLEGGGLPDVTVGQAARRLVRTIRRIRPDGPYALAGYSFGCLVAYEVARQLIEAGAQVTYLGLFDPPGKGHLVDPPELRTFADARPADSGGAARLVEVRSLEQLRTWAYIRHRHLTRSYWRNVFAGDRYRAWFDIGHRAAKRYRPPRDGLTGVRATLYLADGSRPLTDGAAWFASQPVTVQVDGDHTTMLRYPYVRSLGGTVREQLRAASDPGHVPAEHAVGA